MVEKIHIVAYTFSSLALFCCTTQFFSRIAGHDVCLFVYFKQITFRKDESCTTLCTKTYKADTPEDMKKLEFLKNGIALNYQNHW